VTDSLIHPEGVVLRSDDGARTFTHAVVEGSLKDLWPHALPDQRDRAGDRAVGLWLPTERWGSLAENVMSMGEAGPWWASDDEGRHWTPAPAPWPVAAVPFAGTPPAPVKVAPRTWLIATLHRGGIAGPDIVMLHRSTDNQATWSDVPLNNIGEVRALFSDGEGRAALLGTTPLTLRHATREPRVLWTDDAGASWEDADMSALRSPLDPAYGASHTARGVLLVYDVLGRKPSTGLHMLRSRDMGRSWSDQVMAGGGVSAILERGTADLLAFAQWGQVLHSDDDGVTWSVVAHPADSIVFPRVEASHVAIILALRGGRVLRSVDEGQTWQDASTGTRIGTSAFSASCADGQGRIVLAAPGGVLLVSHDDGQTCFRSSVSP
jgi:photosystem II stability/assembly factor-like uncharacterized protein